MYVDVFDGERCGKLCASVLTTSSDALSVIKSYGVIKS